MEEEGVQLDDETLLSVLSACVHSSLVHTGRKIFSSLVNGKFGFAPSVKHYGCMIDLLARNGGLDEAFKMIGEMSFEPTVSIWGSLLAGSRAQANMELSEIAAQKLVELEPQNSAYYVVLSNMYTEMGRWKDVEKVRVLMKLDSLAFTIRVWNPGDAKKIINLAFETTCKTLNRCSGFLRINPALKNIYIHLQARYGY